MLAATDIETYHRFDGTHTSYEYIRDNQASPGTFKTPFKDMIAGNLYPILNAQAYTLGTIVTESGEEFTFTDVASHWEAILKLHKKAKRERCKLYIYGHNHRYDFFGYAREHLFDANMKLIIEDPLFAIYDETTYFLDTHSFYKGSLEEIGKKLNMPKGIMPLTITNEMQLQEYCLQDSRITLQAMIHLRKMLASIDLAPYKMQTAGQTAMTTFQSFCRKNNLHWHFMRSGVMYRSAHIDQARLAYRGARGQAFRRGTFDNVTCLDIRRAYSKAMCDMPFPQLQDPLWLAKPSLKDWQLIKDTIGVMQCTIEVDTKELPYLMAYTRLKEKPQPVTVYPRKGKIIGTWTIFEVRRALELGGYRLISIHWAECYKQCKVNPLKIYIEKLYALGQDRPELDDTIKLLCNNLSGKFAQRRPNSEIRYCFRDELQTHLDQGWEFVAFIEDRAILRKTNGVYEAPYTNPLISAYITAYSRDHHYSLLRKVPPEDLLYCQTDSIVFKGDHLDKFTIDPLTMGGLKIEAQGQAVIHGRKNWSINGNVKLAGYPKRDMTPDIFTKPHAEMRRMIGIHDAIEQGDLSRIGQFRTTTFDLTGVDIDSLPIPEYIDEREVYHEKAITEQIFN